MGAACFKSAGAVDTSASSAAAAANQHHRRSTGGTGNAGSPPEQSTVRTIFDRLDKEKKGYLNEKNLQDLLRDERSFFQGKDATHILNKFGSDNKITFEQFKGWWSSTYTTYEDLDLGALVDEVSADQSKQQQGKPVSRRKSSLDETSDMDASSPPLNSNVAVSRS
jgi:hypothetical protein